MQGRLSEVSLFFVANHYELHEEQLTGLLYTREEMPLRATKEGEAIDYELAFYRRPTHSVRIYDEDWYES